VGLPGNPLAAMMAMLTVAAPLLAGLRGSALDEPRTVASADAFEPLPGRSRLVPYRVEAGRAVPSTHQRSGMLRGLAGADGVLVVPPEGCAAGDLVPALALPWPAPGI
jgi:molybdopterin molybdotransferase